VIQNTTDPQLAAGQPAASEWMFGSRPLNSASAAVAGQFAVEELDGAKVGLLSVSSSFGKQGVEGVKEGVTEAGGEITAERTFEFNATDLTEPALAMTDTDVVIDWGTPNTVTLAVTTLNQQGLGDKPHIGPGSVGFPSFAASVGDPALLENVYGAVDCNPVDDSRESTKAWVARFEDLYDYEANYASAELYDSIFMIRQVIEEAESSEATVIRDGLKALDWSGGVCAKRYVNKDNILMHQTVMTKFSDGALTTIKEYEGI
jgi:branched-chain amino acid transport system substrate-binding protein